MQYWRIIFFQSILFFTVTTLQSQETGMTQIPGTKLSIKPVIGLQIWSSYTLGTEVYDADENAFVEVDDRLNFQLRRSRLGVKGAYGERLKFNFTAAADLVGRDGLAGTEAGQNNGGFPLFRLWNAWVQWKAQKQGEAIYITAGFMTPKVGRESMTPGLKSPSMEKGWSQNYLRRYLVGTGPGRSGGVNVGGLLGITGNIKMEYDVGVFNPALNQNGNTTAGIVAGPLFISRIGLQFGDPESDGYTLGKNTNYFGERQGFSIGLAGSYNKGQETYEDSYALGADWLLNLGQLNIDGDITQMARTSVSTGQTVHAHTGYARVTYNFPLENDMILMPAVLYYWYMGEEEMTMQEITTNVGMPSGQETALEASLHLYIKKKYRLTLAYTMRTGNSGELPESAEVNNYFTQPNIGPIKRGDWIGLGIVATF